MDHASDVAVLRLWKHEPKALTDFIFLLWLASSDTQVLDTKTHCAAVLPHTSLTVCWGGRQGKQASSCEECSRTLLSAATAGPQLECMHADVTYLHVCKKLQEAPGRQKCSPTQRAWLESTS